MKTALMNTVKTALSSALSALHFITLFTISLTMWLILYKNFKMLLLMSSTLWVLSNNLSPN